jgi:multisubunit Na+/H+ antiporter MnhG subunit
LLRGLAFYAAGVIAGIQIALYLFDLYDDGVADVKSGIIGVLLLVLGVMFVAWSVQRSSRRPRE